MAPVDFEKEVRDHLRSRSLDPKTDSWEKIEARLEENNPGNKRSFPYWMALAAAAVVGICLFLIIPDRSIAIEQDGTESIVNEERKIQPEDSSLEGSIIPQNDLVEAAEEAEDRIQSNLLPAPQKQEISVVAWENKNSNNLTKKEILEPVPELEVAVVKAIDQEIAQLSDQFIAMENVKDITDAEIDSLLKAAQNRILKNQSPLRKEQNIDAMALLNQAEGELDQSFREKIFEKLKLGFDKVRTAVADRNN